MQPREFWRELQVADRTGTLILVLLTSWRTVADTLGMAGADVASALFRGLCGVATERASSQSSLALNLFGAFCIDEEVEAVTHSMDRWLPMRVSCTAGNFDIESKALIVRHQPSEAGKQTYNNAQAALLVATSEMPEGQRYPALNLSWEECLGS